jgi:hypothetical protein
MNKQFFLFICFLGTTSRGSDTDIAQTRLISLDFLLKQVKQMTHQSYDMKSLGLLDKQENVAMDTVTFVEDKFCIWPFSIEKGRQLFYPIIYNVCFIQRISIILLMWFKM